MKLVSMNNVMDKVEKLWKAGNVPGVSTGFKCLDQFYTVKLGHTTIVTGYPTSGKTQFTLQILCNLTNLYGWKHMIYSPETGMAEEIYAELIHCLTGKTLNKKFANYISEKELFDVSSYISSYFHVLEPVDNEITLDHWFTSVKEFGRELGANTAVIDNWNDLEHDMAPFGNKISEYLKFQLPRFNRFCKTENIHGFLLAHPRNPDMKGKSQPDPPRPDELEGGSLWYAKAQSIICIHRSWSDPNDTTTDVIIHKAKPKIVGKKGNASLQFAPAWNCYFENNDGYYTYPETIFKTNGKPNL